MLRCGAMSTAAASVVQPWGTWIVPALTPLMTSYSRFSFNLYLGSQRRTGRCLNNKPLSRGTEHLTGANKGKLFEELRFSSCHPENVYNTCLTFVLSRSFRLFPVWSQHNTCQLLCDRKTCSSWFCTWRVRSVSLQRGIDDSSCQTLCQSLEGCMPIYQSRSVGGPAAWLENLETQ